MDPIIRFVGASKRFGSQQALDTFTLDVPSGSVFALLGENGAGKTTAIRLMLGLLEPDCGSSTVLGLDSRRQGLQIRQRVGYVPERPTLYDWMTVGEIGWFTAAFYGDGFLSRYRELISQYQLPAEKKLKTLSKGMRAKVALALALAPDPELLVLDEPTSGLDTLVRREFLESMVERAASGKSVFLSSHQIHEVERVADIVAIVRNGKIQMVEKLDLLKSQTVEVTVTLSNGAPQPPPIEGEILRERRRARQWQILARNLGDDQVSKLRQDAAVSEVEVRTPNLEEIFVAYTQSEKAASGDTNEEADNS
ncbi:MAG: ABC transporter ATP-binding protein [Pirellulaceae bacterium]